MRAATRLRLLFAIAVVVIASAFCLLPNASADPAVSNYYEQMVKSDGALAYWRFDETSGLTINDATSASSFDGRWYDPLYMGRTPTLGVSGVSLLSPNRAVQLNGDGIASTPFGQVVAPGSSLNPTSFSVEAWVKPTDLPDPWTYAGDDSETIICSRDLYDQKGYMLFLGAYSDHAQFALNAGNNLRPPAEKNLIVDTTSPAIQRGQWYHVVATIDGSVNPVAMHLYVNGVDAGHVEYEGAFYRNNAGTDTLIGKGSRYDPGTGVHSTEYGFPGVLDEVAIYGRVLSETDVLEHYSQGTPTAPVNEVSPTISGIAKDGESLNVSSNGSWSGTQPMSFSYQWQRCDVSCDDIAGATNGSYTLTTSDIDRTIRLRVKADSVAGSTSEVSDETDPIEPRQLLNTSLPTISGTAQDTHVLTGSLGSWSGSGQIHLHYQWQSCVGATHGDCDPIGDLTDVDYPHSADDVKYTLTSDEVGRVIELQVTADDDYGSDSIDAWSARTAVVLGSVPVSTSLPTIEGILETDETLTGHDADWIGTEPFTSTKLQWLRCSSASDCSPISSETSETYQLKKTDIGYLFELQVTKTNDYGSTTATSAQTAPVQPVTPTNISPPTISGAAKDGVELKGNKGNWKGTADLIDAYQWLRCDEAVSSCASIDGATSEAYKLQKVDIGSKIVFRVAVTNDYGTASVDSDPTAVVEASPPENTTLPTITGLVRDGVTLTAWEGEWNGTVPITYAFQWRLCDEDGALDSCTDITGATTASYTVTTADIGHTIRVRVTAKNVTGIDVAAVSPATGAAEPEPLTNTARPVVTGSAMVGQILSTIGGSWTGSPPIDHYFHWLRCDSNGNACSKIEGATEKSYKVAGPDINHRLRVEELAVNAAGQLTAESESTETVSPWVSSESDYAIQLTAAPNDVLAAGSVVYEVKVRNSRSSSIYIDHLDITLPEGFSFVPGSTRGDVTLAPLVDGRTLGWAGVPEVAAGKTASFQFDVQAGGVGGTFTSDLAATVLSLEPLTLTKVAPVTVETEPTMKLKSDVDWVPVGGSATITGTIFNPTSSPLPVSSVKVVLPTGLEYKPDSASLGDPDVTGQLLRWSNVAVVPARLQREFTFTAKSTQAKSVLTVNAQAQVAVSAQMNTAKTSSTKIASLSSKDLHAAATLSSEEKYDLAYLFRPSLFFDSTEPWRPLEITRFLREKTEASHWAHTVCRSREKDPKKGGWWSYTDCTSGIVSPSENDPLTEVESLISRGEDSDDSFIIDNTEKYSAPGLEKCSQDIKSGRCDYDTGKRSAIYYHGVEGEGNYKGLLYLDYFFFYRYNQVRESAHNIGMHEADWEGIVVATLPGMKTELNKDLHIPATCKNHGVAWVAFNAHGTLWKYGCETLGWKDQSHVAVFVAKGTHASYPKKCTDNNCTMNVAQPVPGREDYQLEGRFNGREAWGYNEEEHDGIECVTDNCLKGIDNIPSEAPIWAFWNGNWGGSGNSSLPGVLNGSFIRGPGIIGEYYDPENAKLPCYRTIYDGDDRHIGELCKTVNTENVDVTACVASKSSKRCAQTIPSVVKMNKRDAIKNLTKNDLYYKQIDKYARGANDGTVVAQAPSPTYISRLKAPKYWIVEITVIVKKRVPPTRGVVADRAVKILKGDEYRLKIGKRNREYSEAVEKGHVTRTVPKSGHEVSPGDEIDVWISKGSKPKLGDVRGLSPERAEKRLEGDPWNVQVVHPYKQGGYSVYAKGKVASTTPAPGSSVGEGDNVTFYLSRGVATKIPSLYKLSPASAREKLRDFGLVPDPESAFRCDKGLVGKQDPSEGKTVAKGTKVQYWLKQGSMPSNPCKKSSVLSRFWKKGHESGQRVIEWALSTFTEPDVAARAVASTNSAKPTEKNAANSYSLDTFKASSSGNSCGNWFGPMVVALACDEAVLSAAEPKDFSAGGTFGMDVNADRYLYSNGPGFAQILGSSALKPGDSASLFGTATSETRLGIRLTTSDGGMAEALFSDISLDDGGRATLRVRRDGSNSKRDGVPDAELRVGGKIKHPSVVHVRPGSPRVLSIRKSNKGLLIRIKATGKRTGISVSHKNGLPIAALSVATKRSATKRIIVPLRHLEPKTVTLVSVGPTGILSGKTIRTRPDKPYLLVTRRTRNGLRIGFLASAKKTYIRIFGVHGERITSLSVKTKPKAKKSILIPLRMSVRARSIALVSSGSNGFDSGPLVRRIRP